jgi:hypothetical protein
MGISSHAPGSSVVTLSTMKGIAGMAAIIPQYLATGENKPDY